MPAAEGATRLRHVAVSTTVTHQRGVEWSERAAMAARSARQCTTPQQTTAEPELAGVRPKKKAGDAGGTRDASFLCPARLLPCYYAFFFSFFLLRLAFLLVVCLYCCDGKPTLVLASLKLLHCTPSDATQPGITVSDETQGSDPSLTQIHSRVQT